MRNFLPYDRKYSPDQARDDNGRFASGGGGGGGSGSGRTGGGRGARSALSDASHEGGAGRATKILAGMIVLAGGVAHFQAYIRRLQRVANASDMHEAIGLALSPVRRKAAEVPRTGDLADQLDHLEVLTDEEAQRLLQKILALIPQADAAQFLDGIRREGLAA